MSKSDPQVYLYTKNRNGNWDLSGKTELIHDNLDPNFVTTFKVKFIFEQQ